MKIKKIILSCIIILSSNIYAQKVKFEITNKTGFDIDSFSFYNKYIGLLKKDSIIIVECDTIFTLGQFEFPKGDIKGKKRHLQSVECASFRETITTGNYWLDIVMREDSYGYALYYRQKEK